MQVGRPRAAQARHFAYLRSARHVRCSTFFSAEHFIAENGFRPGNPIHFVNHHGAHALTALFHTDLAEALIQTADGIGDNISYSVRSLCAVRIDLHCGDDNLLASRRSTQDSLAAACGYATAACDFRMWRHEGTLTGLSVWHEEPIVNRPAECRQNLSQNC